MCTNKFCSVLFGVTDDWYKRSRRLLLWYQHIRWSKFDDNTWHLPVTPKRDIDRKSRFFHTPYSTTPSSESPLKLCHNVWYGKNWNGVATTTRRWTESLKICLLVSTRYTDVRDEHQTDGRTDTARRQVLLFERDLATGGVSARHTLVMHQMRWSAYGSRIIALLNTGR